MFDKFANMLSNLKKLDNCYRLKKIRKFNGIKNIILHLLLQKFSNNKRLANKKVKLFFKFILQKQMLLRLRLLRALSTD